MLLWTLGCIGSYGVSGFLGHNPRSGIAGSTGSSILIFWGNSILFSTVAAPICIPTNSALGFPFLHILSNICLLIWLWWPFWLVWPLWKTVWNFLRKLKMQLPFDPAIPHLEIYPKNPETPIWKNICTPMFISSIIYDSQDLETAQVPIVDEWTKKMWYIHTMEYNAAVGQE